MNKKGGSQPYDDFVLSAEEATAKKNDKVLMEKREKFLRKTKLRRLAEIGRERHR